LVDVALAPAAWLMDATLAAPGRDATLWRLAANGGACTVWLVGLSYGMVVALERVGALIGVSAAVVGITVGAAGTSFPNLVSSMVAARDGHANMAVSNALGSNTFNLCICLGLPWLLYPFVYGEPYEALHDYSVVVDVALLAFVLAVYVGVLVAYDYTLHAFMGYVFGLTWVAFLACSILLGREIDVVENHVQGGN
jgi:Ca2+/Na+ antiporter